MSKNDFHQQTACVAPVFWSKYTTEVLAPKIGIILVQMPLWLIALANTGNCKKNLQVLFSMAAPAANPILKPPSFVNYYSYLKNPTKILSSPYSIG